MGVFEGPQLAGSPEVSVAEPDVHRTGASGAVDACERCGQVHVELEHVPQQVIERVALDRNRSVVCVCKVNAEDSSNENLIDTRIHVQYCIYSHSTVKSLYITLLYVHFAPFVQTILEI